MNSLCSWIVSIRTWGRCKGRRGVCALFIFYFYYLKYPVAGFFFFFSCLLVLVFFFFGLLIG